MCADSSEGSDPPSTQIKANRTVRMTDEESYLVTNKSNDGTSRTMPDCEGSSGSTRLLRPAPTPSSDLKTDRISQDTDGMRLVHNAKWQNHGIQHTGSIGRTAYRVMDGITQLLLLAIRSLDGMHLKRLGLHVKL